MSRIILSRHDDGQEHIVCGWDAMLQTAFIDEYDHFGDLVRTRGPLNGERLGPGGIAGSVGLWTGKGMHGDREYEQRITTMLFQHSELEYPESNVVVDLAPEAVAVSQKNAPAEEGR